MAFSNRTFVLAASFSCEEAMSYLPSALSQDLCSRAMHHGSVCPEGARTRVLNGITYIGFAIRAPALVCNDNGHHWKYENQWKSPRDSELAWHMTPLQNLQSCHYAAGSVGIVSDLTMCSGMEAATGSWFTDVPIKLGDTSKAPGCSDLASRPAVVLVACCSQTDEILITLV